MILLYNHVQLPPPAYLVHYVYSVAPLFKRLLIRFICLDVDTSSCLHMRSLCGFSSCACVYILLLPPSLTFMSRPYCYVFPLPLLPCISVQSWFEPGCVPVPSTLPTLPTLPICLSRPLIYSGVIGDRNALVPCYVVPP